MSDLSSQEIFLSPLGVLSFIAHVAHSEFEKTPRFRAKELINYAISLAEQRGYPKADHFRRLFKQPDHSLIDAEIKELGQYVDALEVFEHFGVYLHPVKG